MPFLSGLFCCIILQCSIIIPDFMPVFGISGTVPGAAGCDGAGCSCGAGAAVCAQTGAARTIIAAAAANSVFISLLQSQLGKGNSKPVNRSVIAPDQARSLTPRTELTLGTAKNLDQFRDLLALIRLVA